MADLHRRAGASSTRLTPEEITNRGFASAFRGISETEVRNFLRRIADEVVAMRTREADLARQVEELQEQLRNPAPVTEQQLLSSLGEETARVLRSAQGAGEEIRSRSEERAAALVREAQEEAARLREEALQHAGSRKEEAELRAAEVESLAEARATQLREEAERDAEALREQTTHEAGQLREEAAATAAAELAAARAGGHELVEDARTVRERVLADLGRRRSLLQAQVDELRSGRDRLLDAYRVVKRTLSDATDALAQVEVRANTELAEPPPRMDVPPVEGELEVLELTSASGPVTPADAKHAGADTEADAGEEQEIGLEGESVVVIDDAAGAPSASDRRGGEPPGAEDSGAAVDALFARLRASHTAPPGPVSTLPAPAPAVGDAVEEEAPGEERSPDEPGEPEASKDDSEPETTEMETVVDTAAAAAADASTSSAASNGQADPAATSVETPAEEPPEPEGPDDVLRAERGEVLAPLSRDLTRRAKRALQDQQNELLDGIRTIKGMIDAAEVLPTVEAQEAAWVAVLEEPLSAAFTSAYAGQTESGDATSASAPRELFEDIARAMVEPWRERLVSAIDGAGEDPDAITQRLGARYREYRGRELDDALGDALAAAWARGAYAAVPDGTLLRWIPAEVGRCPDCDDNALELTAKRAPFPTGQLFPPAHPGCRCFIVRAEPVATSA